METRMMVRKAAEIVNSGLERVGTKVIRARVVRVAQSSSYMVCQIPAWRWKSWKGLLVGRRACGVDAHPKAEAK